MEQLNMQVLLDHHSGIWHPNRDIRLNARKAFRRAMSAIDFLDFWKVVDGVKIPCLMHLREVYETIALGFPAQCKDPKIIIEQAKELQIELDWIYDMLGSTEGERLKIETESLYMQVVERGYEGTLLSYV